MILNQENPLELSDEALMTRFCQGQNSAFQLLFEKYRDRIFRYIYHVYEKNRTRAEDYTQEVFLLVIRNREKFNPAMVFSTWLYTVARNFCLNQLQKVEYRLEINSDSFELITIGGKEVHAESANSMENAETGEIIRTAIEQLPEPLKAIFVMREIDGLSHAEIGEIFNMKAGHVRIQLHRAKKKLQELISPYLEGIK
jgi:RNA polymerase sigma-70 factor (ECF subfamily)